MAEFRAPLSSFLYAQRVRIYLDRGSSDAERSEQERDCACALATAPDSFGGGALDLERLLQQDTEVWRIHPLPERMRKASTWVAVPLGDGEHTAFLSPYQPHGLVAVLNQTAQALWRRLPAQPFAVQGVPEAWHPTLTGLYQAGLLLDADARDFDFATTQAAALSLWVEVTRGCNLDCPYCYVPKEGPVLSSATFRSLLPGYLQEAARLSLPLRLKFAGGEPTLAWNHLLSLYRWARTAAHQHGVPLQPVLLTNGTLLTPDRLAFLAQEGFALAVSLDGFANGHDAHRTARNGRPTAARVRQTVIQARALGIPVSLTNTITRHNIADIPAFVAFAVALEAPFNLNFYRPRQWPDPLLPASEDLIARVLEALDWLEAHLPRYRVIDGLLDRARFDAPHTFVCDAGRTYHAVNVHGRRAACPMLLGDASGWATAFRVSPVHEREGCADCPWRFWCGGGCPIVAAQAYGSLQAASPYCHVYQALYPHLVRLEGLRVLRYGQVAHSPLPL